MIRPSRIVAALGTLGAAAALVVVVSSGSEATAPGYLLFSPATGDQDTSITLTTSGLCPPTATNLIVTVTGGDPGTASSKVTDGVIVGNTALAAYSTSGGGYVVPLTQTFKEFAQAQGFTPIKGEYEFTLTCRTSANPASLGDFVSSLAWTSSGPFDATYALAHTATTTVLGAAPTAPVLVGTAVTLTATVTPAAAGTVQFKNGASNLGSPVTVSGGTAQLTTSALPAGNRSLTAVFTPTDTAAYDGSVSNALAYYVALPAPAFLPTITPAPRLNTVSTCLISAANATTLTYSWLKDGVAIPGATARTYLPPDGSYNHQLSCQALAHNADNPDLLATSVQSPIGVGPALRPTHAPYLSGTVRAGYRVYCNAGTWTPAATSYGYRWQLDNKYLSPTATSIVIPSTWHGHVVNCVGTAKRYAYVSGVAASNRVRVP